MDVNNRTRFNDLLTFAGILFLLIPDGASMAQTVATVQDLTPVRPIALTGNDTGPEFGDSVWIILLALGGFLYLVNKRSV